VAWLAVDVGEVVALDVERLGEDLVERVLPARRAQRCRRCQYAVEVEEDCVKGEVGHRSSFRELPRAHIGWPPGSGTLIRGGSGC
jgi:hypothetical protein